MAASTTLVLSQSCPMAAAGWCVQLQHTNALLMLLGNINYLVQKMSSTVVSSLMTGVPIIADSTVLASYTFLKPEHIFLMGPHETEMDVMQRVSSDLLTATCMSPPTNCTYLL